MQKQLNTLKRRRLKPKLQKLDNKASQLLIDFIEDKNIDYQLVPPTYAQMKFSGTRNSDFQKSFYLHDMQVQSYVSAPLVVPVITTNWINVKPITDKQIESALVCVQSVTGPIQQ